MKSCITTSHLYGVGGGAKAVFACASAMASYGQVTIFTRTSVPKLVLDEMPKDNIFLASYYPGCSQGYDLHLNIDHFRYETPAAKLNVAHIFHPHANNRPPEGYDWLVANSMYTSIRIADEWDMSSSVLYLPIEDDYYVGQKERMILHCSRFSAPTQYADKGHRQMIQAFRFLPDGWRLVMVGSIDPNQHGYFSSLMSEAQGANVSFAVDQPRASILNLFSRASIYWHMTGISMPNVPGAQEHLGLTTIEAMASGCVPIVRGTGGQPEIVRHGLNGILVSSKEELASVTGKLMSDLHIMALLSQQSIRSGSAWMGYAGFKTRFEQAVFDRESNSVPVPVMYPQVHGIEDVAIIIPIYNSLTVSSCLDNIAVGPEVIVVDNCSDEQVSHPRIDKYIRLESNEGFSKANMIGFEATDKPLILALNDDCIPPGVDNTIWLGVMINTIDEPGVGVVGAKLVYPDGRLQHCGIVFDWNRDDVGYHRFYGHRDTPAANQRTDIPAVTGACLLSRRELFDLMPDVYPMGNYEDAHLCFNAWRNGWRVVYQPAAELVHIEGVTKRSASTDFVRFNRAAFLGEWRSEFLDGELMATVRGVNRDVISRSKMENMDATRRTEDTS